MPTKTAGTEVYTWALAKSLQRNGHHITIVLPKYGTDSNDEYEYDGLSVKRYAEPNHIDKSLINGKRPPDGIGAFKEIISSLNPDVVHVHELTGSSGIGIFHLRWLNTLNIRVIFTMHLAGYSCFCGTLMYKRREPCSGKIDIRKCTRCALNEVPVNSVTKSILYKVAMPLYNINIDTGSLNNSIGTAFSYPFIINKLRTRLLEISELCEKIIVLTDWYRDVLLINGIPENKIRLIKQALPYSVEKSSYEPEKAVMPIRIVFIGRIDPLKGIHLLLTAFADLPRDKIQLDIYGAINDEKYFRYWKDKTIGNLNVKWKGTLTQKEVVKTIKTYHALVLPSTFSEMSPLVIQEAFAAAVPVIGAKVKGITEQIQDGINGLLFEFGNARSLEMVLKSIITDPEKLHRLHLKIKPPGNFDDLTNATLQLYRSDSMN